MSNETNNISFEYLQERGVNVDIKIETKSGGFVNISRGSVVEFEGSAIVNAANKNFCLGGSGLSGIIERCAGEEYELSVEKLIEYPLLKPVRVLGGDLDVDYVIQGVGPNFNVEDTTLTDLVSSYKMIFEETKDLSTVATSFLSSGIFRGSEDIRDILQIAIESAINYVAPGQNLYLVCFTDEEIRTVRSFFNINLCMPSLQLQKDCSYNILESDPPQFAGCNELRKHACNAMQQFRKTLPDPFGSDNGY